MVNELFVSIKNLTLYIHILMIVFSSFAMKYWKVLSYFWDKIFGL